MTRKTTFFEGWSSFKLNNLGQALGMALRFYTSVAKGLKIKVIKLWELIHAFVKVTVEKLVGRSICPTPILNWVNKRLSNGAMLSQTEFFFVFEGISCRCHFNKTGLFSHCSVKWYLLFLLFNVVCSIHYLEFFMLLYYDMIICSSFCVKKTENWMGKG